MFTGLIQSLGQLKSLGNDRFQISCTSSNSYQILQDLAIGDSVAVDGVCLTVVSVLPQGFVAIASPETLRRTNLGAFPDASVNLETSLRAGSKLGGHFVTGHVDAIGTLATSTQTANACRPIPFSTDFGKFNSAIPPDASSGVSKSPVRRSRECAGWAWTALRATSSR